MDEKIQSAPAALRVRVSAPAAPNPRGRMRGKPARLWTKDAVTVEVVDKPAHDGQISHESLASLQADPYIKVEILDGDLHAAAASQEVSALKVRLQQAEERIEQLVQGAAAEAERLLEERRMSSRALEEAGRKVEAAEGEIANLRAKLAAAQEQLVAAQSKGKAKA